jgi:hypothetical protein
MKKISLYLFLGMLCLCGCSSRYVLTLNNGSQVGTTTKPQLRNGTYYFKDVSGQDASVPAGRVREVAPASMAGQPQSQFNPSSK